ncbi:MAG: hypothetical protein ABIW76_03195 [Fibrobacteria bacterium]
MASSPRSPLRFLKHALTPAVIVLATLVSDTHAQWAWSKSVGIGGTTVWGAAAMDKDESFYFGGVSDKLGTPPRGFVMAKYSDTVGAKWNTKLLGGSGAYAGETCIGVDSSGNSYMIDKFGTTPLKLPDATEISYFLPCYFVSKYSADGALAWCKRLVVSAFSRFQVMPDGTVGLQATTSGKFMLFGTDSLAVAANLYFIEIKPDGAIGRMVAGSDVTPNEFVFAQWIEPGKLFAVTVEGIPGSGTSQYHRGSANLEAKTFTDDGTTLKVVSSPNTFRWENNGFPNSPTTAYEPKSGQLFVLMSAVNGDSKLNDADTIMRQTNTQVKDGYVVELDEQMKVVRKVRLTNPLQLAVRDSQVVVTAWVRATSDFGFVSPDTTIRITLKNANNDGLITYVMDRNLKYKQHGLVEGRNQATPTPNTTMIGSDGGVFLSLAATSDLTFQGLPIMNRGTATGTVLSKLGIATPASIAVGGKSRHSRVHMDPIANSLIIDQPGAFKYRLANLLGVPVASGEGSGRAVCDLSRASQGMYFLILQGKGGPRIHLLRKLDP